MEDFPALFSDGRSAAHRPVRLVLDDDDIVLIENEGGSELLRRRLAQLRNLGHHGKYVRVGFVGDSRQNFLIDGGRTFAALRLAAPAVETRRRVATRPLGIAAAVFLVLVAAVLLLPSSRKPPQATQEAPVSMKDVDLSQALPEGAEAPPIEGEWCPPGPGSQALQRLVDRLLRAGKVGALEFGVFDSQVPDALALPGDRLVVFRGLIGLARTPDELAGALAHAVAHVKAGHPGRNPGAESGLWRWIRTFLGLRPADPEREADDLARALLAEAGLDPDALDRFRARLAVENPSLIILESHLLPNVRRLGPPAPTPAPLMTPEAWMAVKSLCR